MRAVKKYSKGGPIKKMSDRAGTNDLGTEEKLLSDALSLQGYGTGDLLKMLALSKVASPAERQAMRDAIFSGKTDKGKPAVRAHVDEGKVRISELKDQESGYYPSRGAGHVKDEVYEKIVGRDIAPSEEKFLRKIMSDPALASYFMDIMGEPTKDRAKVRLADPHPKSTGMLPGGKKGIGPKMPASCRGGNCSAN